MFFHSVGVVPFITSQRQCLVALGVPAFGLAGECAAAAGWQCTVAVLAGLLFEFGLLFQPAFPVTADQGAEVLVGGVGWAAASPSDAQRLQLLALPF